MYVFAKFAISQDDSNCTFKTQDADNLRSSNTHENRERLLKSSNVSTVYADRLSYSSLEDAGFGG